MSDLTITGNPYSPPSEDPEQEDLLSFFTQRRNKRPSAQEVKEDIDALALDTGGSLFSNTYDRVHENLSKLPPLTSLPPPVAATPLETPSYAAKRRASTINLAEHILAAPSRVMDAYATKIKEDVRPATQLFDEVKERVGTLSQDIKALSEEDRAGSSTGLYGSNPVTKEMSVKQLTLRAAAALRVGSTALGIVGDTIHTAKEAAKKKLQTYAPMTYKVARAAKRALYSMVPTSVKERVDRFIKKDLPRFNAIAAASLEKKVGIPKHLSVKMVQDAEGIGAFYVVKSSFQAIRLLKAAKVPKEKYPFSTAQKRRMIDLVWDGKAWSVPKKRIPRITKRPNLVTYGKKQKFIATLPQRLLTHANSNRASSIAAAATLPPVIHLPAAAGQSAPSPVTTKKVKYMRNTEGLEPGKKFYRSIIAATRAFNLDAPVLWHSKIHLTWQEDGTALITLSHPEALNASLLRKITNLLDATTAHDLFIFVDAPPTKTMAELIKHNPHFQYLGEASKPMTAVRQVEEIVNDHFSLVNNPYELREETSLPLLSRTTNRAPYDPTATDLASIDFHMLSKGDGSLLIYLDGIQIYRQHSGTLRKMFTMLKDLACRHKGDLFLQIKPLDKELYKKIQTEPEFLSIGDYRRPLEIEVDDEDLSAASVDEFRHFRYDNRTTYYKDEFEHLRYNPVFKVEFKDRPVTTKKTMRCSDGLEKEYIEEPITFRFPQKDEMVAFLLKHPTFTDIRYFRQKHIVETIAESFAGSEKSEGGIHLSLLLTLSDLNLPLPAATLQMMYMSLTKVLIDCANTSFSTSEEGSLYLARLSPGEPQEVALRIANLANAIEKEGTITAANKESVREIFQHIAGLKEEDRLLLTGHLVETFDAVKFQEIHEEFIAPLYQTVKSPLLTPQMAERFEAVAIPEQIESLDGKLVNWKEAVYFHGAPQERINEILVLRAVTDEEGVHPGSFVSTIPEKQYGKCMFGFRRNIEFLSPITHADRIINGMPPRQWIGFKRAIPLTLETLVFIATDQPLTIALIRQLMPEIPILSLREVEKHAAARALKEGFTVLSEWPTESHALTPDEYALTMQAKEEPSGSDPEFPVFMRKPKKTLQCRSEFQNFL